MLRLSLSQGSIGMAVRHKRRGFPPHTLQTKVTIVGGGTKFIAGNIWSGHFWYTNFWVLDPPLPPSLLILPLAPPQIQPISYTYTRRAFL